MLGLFVFSVMWMSGLWLADSLSSAGYLQTVWVMVFGGLWFRTCCAVADRITRMHTSF